MIARPSLPDPRRCARCGRALAPHETACEGCALEAVTTEGGWMRVLERAPLAFGILAATIEMGVILWLLYGRR